MSNFAATAEHGFKLFGPTHLVTVALIVVVLWGLYFFRNISDRAKRIVSWVMAICLIADEPIYQYWRLSNGIWDLKEHLPLHLCSIIMPLAAIVLIWRNYRWYECVLMLAAIGPVMSILTPNLDAYGFPHYRYCEFFFAHALMIAAMLWVTWCYKLMPTWRSVWNAMKILLGYAVVIFIINCCLGSNYLFINHKLPTASILDLLPPWPGYLVVASFALLIWWTLVWLVFACIQKVKYSVSWKTQCIDVWRDKTIEKQLHHPGGARFLEFYPECASDYPECVRGGS